MISSADILFVENNNGFVLGNFIKFIRENTNDISIRISISKRPVFIFPSLNK